MIFSRGLLLALALACCVLAVTARDSSLSGKHAARRGTHGRSALRAAAGRRTSDSAGKSNKGQKRKVLRRAAGSCKPRPTSAGTTLTAGVTITGTSPASSVATSTSSSASSSSTLVTQVAPALSGGTSQVASTPVSSSSKATPTSTSSVVQQQPTSTSISSTIQQATSSSSSAAATASDVSVDRSGDGPFSGQFTWYALGTDGSSLGACGTSLVDSDKVAAVSMLLFDSWPGYNGANPNNNPICGHSAKVSYGGKSVVVRIEDRCVGCAERDLDLSESAFKELADLGVGRAEMTWEWVS